MPKKKDEGGAPMYMALFTSLMTVLLAFFILLNTMAKQQEAGFKKGIGGVKNSFGLKGGFGLFQFTFFNSFKTSQPVDEEHESEEGEEGIHEDTTSGEGGAGNTDEELDKLNLGEYLRLTIPKRFELQSTSINNELAKYLEVTGTGFAFFPNQIGIRCYAGDTGKPEIDRGIASKRAASIMRFLNATCHIPISRMYSVGYPFKKNLVRDLVSPEDLNSKQLTYFYIYTKET